MPLLDQFHAAGITPGRQRKTADLFAEHPGLDDEVRACRAGGYSWKQIAAQITAAYGAPISSTALSDHMERR